MPYTTTAEKVKILGLHDVNISNGSIAREMGRDTSTIGRIISKYDENRDLIYKRPRAPYPTKMTAEDDALAVQMVESGEGIDATHIQKTAFPHLSAETVRRHLTNLGLPGRIRRKKPLLTEEHVQMCYEWARAHLDWTVDDWRQVIFSDEAPFKMFQSGGRQWCRRRPGEELEPRNVQVRVKHGGKGVMVWGCITSGGVGRLERVHGLMDRYQYIAIIDDGLHDTLDDYKLTPSDIIFQQDNDSKHTARYSYNWLQENQLLPLWWPPNSPDMNIIENIWWHLGRRMLKRERKPTNQHELFQFLEEEWLCIPDGIIRDLYDSMPTRVRALFEAKGMWTKY